MYELADHAFEKGDREEAYAWLEQAGKGGDAEAYHRLATRILAEEPKSDRKDADGRVSIVTDGRAARSRDYYRRAAELGHVESSLELARLFDGKLGDRDPFQAFHWYKKAADAGDLLAQREVAERCLLGIGTSKSPVEAVFWLRKIAEDGRAEVEREFAITTACSEAIFKLGVLTFVGKGTSPDRTEGLRLMQKAAEQGNRTARRFLEERDRSWLWRCLFNRFHWPSLSYLDR
jgi:TPR repeat protein